MIAQTLFKSGDIESQGTGIMRIRDFCDETGIRVEYVRVPDGTKLVFHRNDAFGQSIMIDNPPNGGINGGIKQASDLSERESRILDYISLHPSASAQDIASNCGIAERTVQRDTKKLRGLGIIVRVGSKKTGRWVVRDAREAE